MRVGLNILSFDENIYDYLEQLRPDWVVVTSPRVEDYIGSVGGILSRSPNTHVIYRAWQLQAADGAYIQMDSFADWLQHNYNDVDVAVAQFFKAYQPVIDWYGGNIWLYTLNETGEPGEGPEEIFDTWIEYHVRLETTARQRGLKLCHLNHGVGTPDLHRYHRIRPLLYAMQGGESVLGLHEYGQKYPVHDAPYYINRHTFLLDEMEAIDAYVPIVLSEFGYDAIPGLVPQGSDGGWRSFWPYDQDEAAYQLERVLAQYTDNIQGASIFCWGGSGRWKQWYDISSAEVLKQRLIEWNNKQGETHMSICDKPIDNFDSSISGTYIVQVDTTLNVRKYPAVDHCAEVLAQLTTGDKVAVSGVFVGNGYTWAKLADDAGWVAMGDSESDWLVPDAEEDTVMVYKSSLIEWRDSLREMADFLDGLIGS